MSIKLCKLFAFTEDSSCDNITAIITGSVAGGTLLVVLGIVVIVAVITWKHSSRHGNHTNAHVE